LISQVLHSIIYLERYSELKFPIALSKNIYFEIASTLAGGMLFLFVVMIVYVRQSHPNIFPIIDQRSYRELTGKEYPIYSSKDRNKKYAELYINYIGMCFQFNMQECPDIPFEFIDKILYQLDKEKGNAVKY